MDEKQFLQYIIDPVLKSLALWSPSARVLLLGTAMAESRLQYIHQIGGGPALGLYQMEPATHDDIVRNYLRYKPALSEIVEALSTSSLMVIGRPAEEMQGNLYYATAMARVHYRRVREALPAAGDAAAMARYWKQYYNTPKGAGTIEKATPVFLRAINLARDL